MIKWLNIVCCYTTISVCTYQNVMCLTKQIEAASYGSDKSKRKEKGKSGPKGISVTVLKREDVYSKDGTTFFPNTIEMAKIRNKKSPTGQFKTGVLISSAMSISEVLKELKKNLPILGTTDR